MSAYPIMVDGPRVSALVVGAGPVAARKIAALAAVGAEVRVVAPGVSDAVRDLAAANERITILEEVYKNTHIGLASLVFAATGDAGVNARVAADAAALGRLANVADAPDRGTFVTPAVHHAGDITIAVTAGGVPAAAARIRDAIADRIDARFADAVSSLAALRRSHLDTGARDQWRAAAADLLGASFVAEVEAGRFDERLAVWR